MPPKNYQRRRKWFAWLLLAGLIGLGIYGANQIGPVSRVAQRAAEKQPGLYKVVAVADGDTITVDMNGNHEIVRLIGVDTPETHRPNTPVQCYAKTASAFSKRLLAGQKVRLQADSLETNRDRYGRLLRYVYLPDSGLVNLRLVAEGYGFAYTFFPFEKSAQFSRAETGAQRAGKGLWTACRVLISATGAKQTAYPE